MKKLNILQRHAVMRAILFYVAAAEMRVADFEVVERIGGWSTSREDPTVEEYFKEVLEYAWDHLLGEPTETTVAEMMAYSENLARAIDA